MVIEELYEHQKLIQLVIQNLTGDIETACHTMVSVLKNGKKVLIAGNGGSAADAQHIAAELSGRFVKERKALPGIALTVDTSALTAIANDYGYNHVFSRQIEALAQPCDLFIGISTSGNSQGILNAFETATKIGCKTLGLSGRDGGKMNGICDLNIIVPSDITARIQEMHILIGHILCKAVDEAY
ncbi:MULTISPECIES: D-sedoheptulose 7-phosphate isomerase [unclassified Mucilaginibacter]|uniref:D-sedoheptulose 7-phosphate isomerase n=1 Tax=unclassified Mucilaginibacter TaxID=2617802 RepID=UPI002AC97887|nr:MULTISPECIES: D-sedoheptulose 7-phosphate isomerase [unclassified Mucilaginibacter]MEB0261506.1 D-sedoheptulose 7-phosphate isomerase [Mucilaginibacter sp. 10I4]MEB0277857.1 D-sedoheptulose 7-phosphate isomerase [Mucilaginibacter sp. 10B2]MEB0300596.1 D-sedoheptulose 7-phosphate isomerase [Mucilaginibacter sp. 5C4]WPX22749.1 D-sedoheptulose 7-phosphate isomerase [Mucilaginibacter sp. 5C4]